MSNDIKVNVMFYDKHYNEKPSDYEIAIIQTKLAKTTIPISDLAHSMAKGCTFKPGYLNGTKNKDFISQQIFALDFDDGTTIEQELNRCKELNILPAFGYTSFHHKEEHHKFRLVFCNNEVVYDIEKRNKIQLTLMSLFTKCDKHCKDLSRLFLGGKSLIALNPNNIIDGDDIIEKYYSPEIRTNPPAAKNKYHNILAPQAKQTIPLACDTERKIKAISELNVPEMRRLLNLDSSTETKDTSGNETRENNKWCEQKEAVRNSIRRITGNQPSNLKRKRDEFAEFIISRERNSTENKEDKQESKLSDEELKNVHKIVVYIYCLAVIVVLCNKYLKNQRKGFWQTDNKDSLILSVCQKPPTPQKNPEKIVFKCKKDLFDYINRIDLTEYLGIGDEKVCCILPEHNDRTPSAHIYTNENGIQFYKCFGCDTARNIIGITEHLANCRRSEAIEFIKEVYGLELVETEWTQQQKQLMIDCANYLDTDEFETEFPKLSKLMRGRKNHIKAMLVYFSEKINEDMKIDEKPFFFASYDTLMKICEINNRDSVAKSIALFSLVNMIEKLPEDKIPMEEYAKAKAISAKYGFKKVINFYAFEEYGVNAFSKSEEKAKILKENHISLKGISREWVLRTFGVEEANRIYPQYKFENQRGTSEKSNEHTLDITVGLFNLIDSRGYAKESEVVDMLKKHHSKTSTEIQIKKSLQEILDAYDLKRIRVNKEIKNKYNIKENGYPFIIIRNECDNENTTKEQSEKEK